MLYKDGMYGFLEALLWLSVAIPIAGFGYCMVIESYGEQGFLKSKARWGLLAGAAAALAHLAQAVGLNLPAGNSPHRILILMGFLLGPVPLAGIGLAIIAFVLIRLHGDYEVRSVGTTSAGIAGGSTALLILLFMAGFGTP
jgi:hypothetical protein